MKTLSPRAHRFFCAFFLLASNSGTIVLGMVILALQKSTNLAGNRNFSALVIGSVVAIIVVNVSALRSAIKGVN
jgi:glycerol uptake facilitator-like aquaporin